MDQHALLMDTVMRKSNMDSPARARLDEARFRIEAEAREERSRRRRELRRRAWNALRAFHRSASGEWVRRIEAPELHRRVA